MEAGDRAFIAAIGGALAVYGWIKSRSTKKKDPLNNNRILAALEVPDETERTGGRLALGMAAVCLMAATFL